MRSRVTEKPLEVPGDGIEAALEHDLVVPLDCLFESHATEVGASDISNAVGSVEEIRLGMKARSVRDEDARLDRILGPLLEIEEAEKSVGLPPSPRLRRGKPVMPR